MPSRIQYPITSYTASTACGIGIDALRQALNSSRSGLRPNDYPHSNVETWIGRVSALDSYQWPEREAEWVSRNNALAAIGSEQDGLPEAVASACDRYGRHRVGLIIGTSTSSIGRTEEAYRHLDSDSQLAPAYLQPRVHNAHSPSDFLAYKHGIDGPTMTISTACSSSAKVFASAARWLNQGLVDAVLVGGVDTLCMSVIHGFNSLELTAPEPCKPFDRQRRGISIGEAAAFALLERTTDRPVAWLHGYGESTDAYHMSHPHPDGLGAEMAMTQAMRMAGVDAKHIDGINLHGTASQANDRIEAAVLQKLFTKQTLASSTKGWTGHTLGAAGSVEAIIAINALQTGFFPGTMNLEQTDPEIHFPISQENSDGSFKYVMSNSFGFGGNNCSLLFGANE